MLEILYEDKDIIVVVKPPGMPSQEDKSGDRSVYAEVKAYVGEDRTVGLVQRLDRPVGGIMVLSLSGRSNKALTAMVQNREIDKYYLALVDGQPKDKDHLSHWLQQVRGNRSVISNKKVSGSKSAILSYELLKVEDREDGAVNFLKIKLETGRHHQIRAQLAHVKLPIVGDTKYNSRFQSAKGWYEIGLYAYALSFKHPVSGEVMTFERWPDLEPFIQKDA